MIARVMILLGLLSAAALAKDPVWQRGKTLVEANCSTCHAVGASGASPFKDAPPFREVVKRYPPEQLQESLAEGIVTGHEGMPEFSFAPDQVAGIIAWLNTLKAE